MTHRDARPAVAGYEDIVHAGLAFDPIGDPVAIADPDGRRVRLNYVAEDPYPPESFPHREDGSYGGTVPNIPGVSTRIGPTERESCRSSWEEGVVYGIVSQTFRVDPSTGKFEALSCETFWGCLDLPTACASVGLSAPSPLPAP